MSHSPSQASIGRLRNYVIATLLGFTVVYLMCYYLNQEFGLLNTHGNSVTAAQQDKVDHGKEKPRKLLCTDFFQLKPQMSRKEVEKLVGPPLKSISVEGKTIKTIVKYDCYPCREQDKRHLITVEYDADGKFVDVAGPHRPI